MMENFVPAHLGLQHITRDEVASRNLYIPESLFGNPRSDINLRKAIVIMDIFMSRKVTITHTKNAHIPCTNIRTLLNLS